MATLFNSIVGPPSRLIYPAIIQSFARQIHATPVNDRLPGKLNIYKMNFDRRIKVDYKDSINYMNSEAYRLTYQGHKVWELYRRNHKGHRPSIRTRQTCVNEEGFVDTTFPCPICRDEYLILHPENTKLLEQFINPYTDNLLTPIEHGLCVRQWRNLQIAVMQAIDRGYITKSLPDRLYDYDSYKSGEQ